VSGPEEIYEDYQRAASMFALHNNLLSIQVHRYMESSPPYSSQNPSLPVTTRFVVSPETHEVTSTRVKMSPKNWWKDRISLVAKLSAGSDLASTLNSL